MAVRLTIWRAAPHELDEAVAIDDDACALFATVGLHLDLPPDHPFSRAERARWLAAMREGLAWLAETPATAGLLVLGTIDGIRCVDQLSVRRAAMRQGIGRLLLARAIEWAQGDDLWLTTYAHVPWNRAYYERHGFVVVPEARCPAGIVAALGEQRRWLPEPGQRIAMCRRPGVQRRPARPHLS